ncbi:helix-turn-helix domain-containing protein [Paenibacillus sp. CMM36]
MKVNNTHKKIALETLPHVLTAQNISDFLMISRRVVYELMQIPPSKGGIRNFSIGASRRVIREDFIDWVEAKRTEHELMEGSVKHG